MAARKNQDPKGKSKGQAKGKKKRNIFQRIAHGVSDIKAELKRVVWPDRKKLKQSTATVLAIILMFTVLIYVFDTTIRYVFTATGFYSAKEETVTEETTGTEPEEAAFLPAAAVHIYLSSDTDGVDWDA
ncbi:MAG TPA: preprotein translocase subunit SecE [Clostridiaceae bacterium]|nr:preprotein translocase subunit SecE [Clostridiaceae bacterium]